MTARFIAAALLTVASCAEAQPVVVRRVAVIDHPGWSTLECTYTIAGQHVVRSYIEEGSCPKTPKPSTYPSPWIAADDAGMAFTDDDGGRAAICDYTSKARTYSVKTAPGCIAQPLSRLKVDDALLRREMAEAAKRVPKSRRQTPP